MYLLAEAPLTAHRCQSYPSMHTLLPCQSYPSMLTFSPVKATPLCSPFSLGKATPLCTPFPLSKLPLHPSPTHSTKDYYSLQLKLRVLNIIVKTARRLLWLSRCFHESVRCLFNKTIMVSHKQFNLT